jgi:Domain of unknown function (DUF4185)
MPTQRDQQLLLGMLAQLVFCAAASSQEAGEAAAEFRIFPGVSFQTMTGFGAGICEATLKDMQALGPEGRQRLYDLVYGEEGLRLNILRIHVSPNARSLADYAALAKQGLRYDWEHDVHTQHVYEAMNPGTTARSVTYHFGGWTLPSVEAYTTSHESDLSGAKVQPGERNALPMTLAPRSVTTIVGKLRRDDAAKPPVAVAADPVASSVLRYIPGSTVKIEQLVGEEDKERHHPTLSRTFSRFGVRGTDLGYSFEHEGHTYFLFGDTVGHVSWAEDTIAMTDARDPEKGVRLDFLMDGKGKYLVIAPPGISMGPFETPVGGISLGGQMYVVVRTSHAEDWSTDRAVLTKFIAPGKFHPLRTMSGPPTARFITQSLHLQPGPMPRLPPGGPYVIIWGTGKYRKSDAYLSIVPAAHFETGKGTYYFTGLDAAGAPTWSEKESDAKPIVKNCTLGDLSVT